MNKDTDKLLQTFFEREKCTSESQNLQEKIAKQTFRKNAFSWRKLAIPAVASLLLAVGASILWQQHKPQSQTEISQSQILYEDDDFVIYVQN